METRRQPLQDLDRQKDRNSFASRWIDQGDGAMGKTGSLVRQLAYAESKITAEQIIAKLSKVLFDGITDKPWYSSGLYSFLEAMCVDAVRTLAKKLEKNKESDPKSLDKTIQHVSEDFTSIIFFTPAVVSLMYGSQSAEYAEFINEGITRHCNLIRFAARNVTRKHAAGMQSFSLDPSNLEDELFSNVLEEIVRVLTDMSIRVWKEEDSFPSIYPSMDSRGRRKGYFTHVAITPDGSQVAASRTDHTVLVWDLLSDASPAVWDFSLLLSDGPEEPVQIRRLFFSRDGERLALESANNFVFVFQLKHGEAPIDVYEEKSGDRFLRAFGEPYIPQQAIFDKKRILLPFPNGCRSPLAEYRNKVFDCAWDEGGRTLVTASEMERSMPAWMIDAGFERAVYHIAKMRLIDLIRKRTHTDYICWHCGSAAANRNETHCPKCGADFTACPIGCSTRPGEILSVDNEWKCSQCGMATRLAQSHRELEESELPLSVHPEQRDWASEHDLERILDALGKVTIAYRGREIRCDRLVLLKSQGKTNEEIGREIGVPRGSVDYIWNQCRQEILAYFQYL